MLRSTCLLMAVSALMSFAGCSTTMTDNSESPSQLAAETDLTLVDGNRLRGRIIRTSDDAVVFRVNGEVEPRTYTRSDVMPFSWYLARNANMDVDSSLELARFCLQHDLFDAAAIEMAKVMEQRPSMTDALIEEVARARTERAARLVQESDLALDNGDPRQAERLAAEVVTRFPESRAAASAVAILEVIDLNLGEPADPEALNLHRVAQRAARGSSTQSRLTKSQRYVDRARKRHVSALRTSGSAARERFQWATSDYERALTMLRGMSTEQLQTADALRVSQRMTDVVSERITLSVDFGNFYLNRGSYPQARQVAEEALAIDPESERALTFVRHVEMVTADQEALRRFSRLTGKKYR